MNCDSLRSARCQHLQTAEDTCQCVVDVLTFLGLDIDSRKINQTLMIVPLGAIQIIRDTLGGYVASNRGLLKTFSSLLISHFTDY